MEPHEATDWLRKRTAWERWLTELHHHLEAGAELEVTSLADQRQRRRPALLRADWWNRRSA